MNKNDNEEMNVVKAIAEEHVQKLAEEYREIKGSNLDDVDTTRMDVWFNDFMDKRKSSTPAAREEAKKVSVFPSKRFNISRVAVFVLVFIIAASAVALNTEAIKLRFFGLFTETNEEYTLLNTGESSELVQYVQEKWKGSYYLDMIPEGYNLTDASEFGTLKIMTFTYGEDILEFYQDEEESSLAVDTEGATTESFLIEGQQAFFSQRETDNVIVWVDTAGNSFMLNSSEFSRDDLVQIAENMKKIE